jgi:PIN domain nuclease of toxin-antitoxin system
LGLLLDTHVVLEELAEGSTIGGKATAAIAAAEDLRVSVVSFIEIGIKASVGKLKIPEELHKLVLDSGARILGLTPEHGLGVAALPLHHRDPFDRLLISQARHEGLTILTSDPCFARYDVQLIDATS